MISRLHRFHGHNSLRYVYSHGEAIRGPLFSVKSVRNDRRTVYRLAVVVSKKVSKSAVLRNRIRRRIYEQVRLLEPQINQPHDIVITVFSEQLAALKAPDLAKQLRAQLKQAHILTANPTPVHDKMEKEGE
jgi:ribonuclease P protein component